MAQGSLLNVAKPKSLTLRLKRSDHKRLLRNNGWLCALTFEDMIYNRISMKLRLLYLATLWISTATFVHAVTGSATVTGLTVDSRAMIAVSGPWGEAVPNGSASIQLANGTDFGSVSIGGGLGTRRFTLVNLEADPLLFGSHAQMVITGQAASDFAVVESPEPLIAGGSASALEVRFAPGTPGPRSGVLRLISDQLYGGEYHFPVGGFARLPTRQRQTIYFNPPSSVYLEETPLALHGVASSGLPLELRVISGPGVIQAGQLYAMRGLRVDAIGRKPS
jgi:hypothetical protein